MKVLTVEKEIIDMQNIDELSRYIQFTLVDLGSNNRSTNEHDIVFPKLLYYEEYIGPALDCDIGGNRVMLPLSWYIMIGDEDISEVEALPITSLNARDFTAICTNPIDGFRHHFLNIKIYGVLSDYNWILPKIKNGQCVAVPINKDTNNPLCVYLSHSTTKIPQTLIPTDFM